MSVYSASKSASRAVDRIELLYPSDTHKPRNLYSIHAHANSESGEVSTEIMIHEGHSYKVVGKDGIVGECIDSIMCFFDIIHKAAPHLTERNLEELMTIKAKKWIEKVLEHREKK